MLFGNPLALQIMITHSLTEYRKRYNIPLHDVAFIADVDIGNLSKIERGIREPTPSVALMYHLLFEAPLRDLFQGRLEQEREGWAMRSTELIKLLQEEKPPQSSDRVRFVSAFVNRLVSEKYA